MSPPGPNSAGPTPRAIAGPNAVVGENSFAVNNLLPSCAALAVPRRVRKRKEISQNRTSDAGSRSPFWV